MAFRLELALKCEESEKSLKRRARNIIKKIRSGEFVRIDSSDKVAEYIFKMLNGEIK